MRLRCSLCAVLAKMFLCAEVGGRVRRPRGVILCAGLLFCVLGLLACSVSWEPSGVVRSASAQAFHRGVARLSGWACLTYLAEVWLVGNSLAGGHSMSSKGRIGVIN